MTTRPKGRKFRIRKGFGSDESDTSSAPSAEDANDAASVPEEEVAAVPDEVSDADEAQVMTTQTKPASPPQNSPADDDPDIAAIKGEGLTGRQLRMARRTALKHGISAANDYDAVRQLRARGIDPFARSNMLELIVGEEGEAKAGVPAARPVSDPTVPRAPGDPIDHDTRATEIQRVQEEIAKRRRKRLMLLASRLAFFVALPTFIAAYYFFVIATPLYATNSEFVIQKAESGGGGANPLSGFFGGTTFGTVQESIAVQSYLESREAMLRLDDEHGFRAHFSSREIDPLIRLSPDATDEQMYDVYRRNLQLGYDPTEGLIRLEVRAADAETSQAYSEALIQYAEERVDQMSQRVREDQMSGARDSFVQAEEQLRAAQERVLSLQEQRGVFSTEAELQLIIQQISNAELRLQEAEFGLDELLASERPNATRVELARANIERLEANIANLRSELTNESGEGVSLARVSSELLVAQADLETRQLMLQQALQQMETARIEANRQSLYLSISVFPVSPDAAAYPKALENTLLTLLVFAGIYLMLSMTASILREQVSA